MIALWIGGLILLAAAAGASLAVPVADDEAWFLHVVDRCRMGDTLYRDVFYGATPLAAWLALLAIRVTRPQLLVLRLLGVAYFGLLLAAGGIALRATDVSTPAIAGFLVAGVAFASPSWGVDNHYGQVASTAAVTTVAALALGNGGSPATMAVAGAAVGAAVCGKQSTGAVTAAVAAVAIALDRPPAVGVIVFVATAAMVTAASMAPVVISGAFPAFFRRTIGNKGTYLRSGRITLLEGWRELRHRTAAGPSGSVTRSILSTVFALVPLTVVAIVVDALVLVGVIEGRPAPARVALLAAPVALVGTFPRADLPHVQGVAPLCLLTLVATISSVSTIAGPFPPLLVIVSAALGGTWTFVALALALSPMRRGMRVAIVDQDLPHLRWTPVPRTDAAHAPTAGAMLRSITGGSVFLLRPDAAVWYLAGDLRNPTPYDYPYASVFGPDGQRETVDAIRRGAVAWVCLPRPIAGPLAPVELQDFVLDEMTLVAETPAGGLYRLAGGAATG